MSRMDDTNPNTEDFDGDAYEGELLEEDTELYQDELEQLDRLDDEPDDV